MAKEKEGYKGFWYWLIPIAMYFVAGMVYGAQYVYNFRFLTWVVVLVAIILFCIGWEVLYYSSIIHYKHYKHNMFEDAQKGSREKKFCPYGQKGGALFFNLLLSLITLVGSSFIKHVMDSLKSIGLAILIVAGLVALGLITWLFLTGYFKINKELAETVLGKDNVKKYGSEKDEEEEQPEESTAVEKSLTSAMLLKIKKLKAKNVKLRARIKEFKARDKRRREVK